jgi:hypothetical protein
LPEKIRNGHENRAYANQQKVVGHEVGKNEQQQPANQRHDPLLLFAVNKKPNAYRAEQ